MAICHLSEAGSVHGFVGLARCAWGWMGERVRVHGVHLLAFSFLLFRACMDECSFSFRMCMECMDLWDVSNSTGEERKELFPLRSSRPFLLSPFCFLSFLKSPPPSAFCQPL